jgi:hypothetical protein
MSRPSDSPLRQTPWSSFRSSLTLENPFDSMRDFAMAQPANPKGDTPAVNAPDTPPNPGAPVAGANSFPEGQARILFSFGEFGS